MKVGIVGPAFSGKTTLFNALTGLSAQTGPGKSEPQLGVIQVPDVRVERLVEVYKPKKKTLASIHFVDIPRDDSSLSGGDGGFAPKTVSWMREPDALAVVVRNFESPFAETAPDPTQELRDFAAEMVLTDLLQVENRLERLKKDRSATPQEDALLHRVKEHLEAEKPLRTLDMSEDEAAMVAGFAFLSQKPALAVVNLDDGDDVDDVLKQMQPVADEAAMQCFALFGRSEAEIAELPEEDQEAFIADLGVSASARTRFIQAAFRLLDLISFLTSGEDECRAWPVTRGMAAKQAAGKIHSDIERGFIRAEVTAWEDFVANECSEAKCRAAGKLRLEGKEYVTQDGDIMHFRFNV